MGGGDEGVAPYRTLKDVGVCDVVADPVRDVGRGDMDSCALGTTGVVSKGLLSEGTSCTRRMEE